MSRRQTVPLILAGALIIGGCDGPKAGPTAATPLLPLLDIHVTAGTDLSSSFYVGQSVTIPGTGRFRNITFNWYDRNGPLAFGNLCILGQEFLGVPEDLGPQPRFVAWSQRTSDGQYIFAADVTLVGGNRYWFYTDQRGSALYDPRDGMYAGGDLYFAPFRSFAKWPASMGPNLEPPRIGFSDANFRLQGKAVP